MDLNFTQSEINQMLIAAVTVVMGMISWWIRGFMKDFKQLQRENQRSELNHDKVQTQLSALQACQNELQKDINLVLETLLRKELNKPANRR